MKKERITRPCGIGNRFFGVRRFERPFLKFLQSHTLFLLFTTLPGVFINTYLMGQTDDDNVVLGFNAAAYFFLTVGMHLATFVMRRFSASACAVSGVVIYNIFFLAVLLLRERASDYFWLLGLLEGIGGGFYWLSYGQCLTDTTTDQNRDPALAMINICGSVVNLAAPLFAGAVISLLPGDWGYTSIFGLALAVAAVTAFTLLRLPRMQKEKARPRLGCAYRMVFGNGIWQRGLGAMFFYSLREGVFAFILSILLFRFVRNEALVGFNTFLTGGAAIAASILVNKFVKKNNRVRCMVISVAVLFAASLFFVWQHNAVTALLFSAINAGFFVLETIPVNAVTLSLFDFMPGAPALRPELFAVKELFTSAGRAFGVLLLVAVNLLTGGSLIWQCAMLAVLSLTQTFTILAARSAETKMERLRQEGGSL